MAAAALALVVLNTDLLRFGGPGSVEPVATVETATGRVSASDGKDGSVLALLWPGDVLQPGAVVQTAASLASGTVPARVDFRLAGGMSVRLDAGTRVRILSAGVLALEHGAVYADSGPGAAAGGPTIEIRTRLGVARDVGTQFAVRLDGGAKPLEVQVREGEVILEREGDSHTVRAGFELAVLDDGSVEQQPIARSGDPWDWAVAALPAFDVGGRTLRELLIWAARVSDWQLRFADPALAAQTAGITLNGSIDGLTPEEAAATSLMGSGLGLGYRLEDGVFLVRR